MTPQIRWTIHGQNFDNWGPETIDFLEAAGIEKTYGKSFPKFCDDLDEGFMTARQVLAWSLLRRADKTVALSDLGIDKLGDVTNSVICSECEQPLTVKAGVFIHEDGREDCGTETTEVGPTQGGDPALSSPTNEDSASESTSGEEDTSQPSPTSSESDPGNGAA